MLCFVQVLLNIFGAKLLPSGESIYYMINYNVWFSLIIIVVVIIITMSLELHARCSLMFLII